MQHTETSGVRTPCKGYIVDDEALVSLIVGDLDALLRHWSDENFDVVSTLLCLPVDLFGRLRAVWIEAIADAEPPDIPSDEDRVVATGSVGPGLRVAAAAASLR